MYTIKGRIFYREDSFFIGCTLHSWRVERVGGKKKNMDIFAPFGGEGGGGVRRLLKDDSGDDPKNFCARRFLQGFFQSETSICSRLFIKVFLSKM